MDDERHLRRVLADVGLTTLYDNFVSERINLASVANLSDADFQRLGVVAIGDRVRLRTRAQQELATRNSHRSNGQGLCLKCAMF